MLQPIQFDTVAEIYDDYVTADVDIPFFLEEARRSRGKVLELMCGTGRVSLPLLQAGVDLTCVDYSTGMLDVFRRKLQSQGLCCEVHRMDVTELVLPERFDLIFIPFHSFSEILEASRQKEALRRINAHLREGGRFLCTLQNPTLRAASLDGTLRTIGKFPTRSGSLIVRSQLQRDGPSGLVSGKQFYEEHDRQGNLRCTHELDIHFYLHSKDHFEELARDAGFMVEALYGDYAYSPFQETTSQFMIWRLGKAANDE